MIRVHLWNLLPGCILHKKPVFLHTGMNKAAGLLLFVLPFTFKFVAVNYSGTFVCAVATFAAIQEGHFLRTGKTPAD